MVGGARLCCALFLWHFGLDLQSEELWAREGLAQASEASTSTSQKFATLQADGHPKEEANQSTQCPLRAPRQYTTFPQNATVDVWFVPVQEWTLHILVQKVLSPLRRWCMDYIDKIKTEKPSSISSTQSGETRGQNADIRRDAYSCGSSLAEVNTYQEVGYTSARKGYELSIDECNSTSRRKPSYEGISQFEGSIFRSASTGVSECLRPSCGTIGSTGRPSSDSLTPSSGKTGKSCHGQSPDEVAEPRYPVEQFCDHRAQQLRQAIRELPNPAKGSSRRLGKETSQAPRDPRGDLQAHQSQGVGKRRRGPGNHRTSYGPRERADALGSDACSSWSSRDGTGRRNEHDTCSPNCIQGQGWTASSQGSKDRISRNEMIRRKVNASGLGASFQGPNATDPFFDPQEDRNDEQWDFNPWYHIIVYLAVLLRDYLNVLQELYYQNNGYFLAYVYVIILVTIGLSFVALPLCGIFQMCTHFQALFRPCRNPAMTKIQKHRHRTRGRLIPARLCLTGCIWFCLLMGIEASNLVATFHCLDNPPFESRKASIGLPAEPPQVPEETTDFEVDFADGVDHLMFMNAANFLLPQEIHQVRGYIPLRERPFNLIMFGFRMESVGRREAEIEDFAENTIRAAILRTWRDHLDADLEMYVVDPQPTRLIPEGWTTIIYIRPPGHRHPPNAAIALKEVITFRRSFAYQHEIPEFEAHEFSARNDFHGLLREAGLRERCNERRNGQATIRLGDNMVLLGTIVRILLGNLVTFLIDEALPEPMDIFRLQDPELAHQALQDALAPFPPMQFLNVHLHGYHDEHIYSQSYAAHRPRIENWVTFTQAATHLWQTNIQGPVRVISAMPQRGRIATDGEVEVHYILDFAASDACLILLSRQFGSTLPQYSVIEAEEWFTPYGLLQLVDWSEAIQTHGLPDITWAQSYLGFDDVLQSRHGMHLHFQFDEAPRQDDNSTEPLSDQTTLIQISWSASDRLHGRTIGRNGQRQLKPPGNGMRKVTFSNVIHYFNSTGPTAWIDYTCRNPYLDQMCNDTAQNEVYAEDKNCFLANFREQTSRGIYRGEDNLSSWMLEMIGDYQVASEANSFAMQSMDNLSLQQLAVPSASHSAWREMVEQPEFPGPCEIWTPSGPQYFGNHKSYEQILAAGFKVYVLEGSIKKMLCIGDPSSKVVPTIFESSQHQWIIYCALGSQAKELVRYYFAASDSQDDFTINQAGARIILATNKITILQLDQLVPEAPFTILDFNEVAELHHALRHPILPAKLPEYPIEWLECTQTARSQLWELLPGDPRLPDRYEFYTDGTAKHRAGAATVVALAYIDSQPFWIGTRGAAGETPTTANRMEASAMMLALLWAHEAATNQEERQCAATFAFYYDSVITGNIASGLWTPHCNTDLHDSNRSLVQWLQSRRGVKWIEWEHIPAHQGHPWNEAADTVAEAISSGLLQAPAMTIFAAQLEDPQAHEWLWYWETHRWSPHVRFTSSGPKIKMIHNFDKPEPVHQHAIIEHLNKAAQDEPQSNLSETGFSECPFSLSKQERWPDWKRKIYFCSDGKLTKTVWRQ